MTSTSAQTDPSVDDLVERVRSAQLPPPEERRLIREAAGLSQRAMARALGIAPVTFIADEAGTRPIPLARATEYRRLLDGLRDAVAAAS